MDQKSSLLNRAWRVLQKNPAALLGAAQWPYLAVFAAAAIARAFLLGYVDLATAPTEPLEFWRSLGPLVKVGIVVSYFLYTSVPQGLAVAGISVVTWEGYLGGNAGLWHGLLEVRRRFLVLLALSFVVGFASLWLGVVAPIFGQFVIHTLFLPTAVVVLILERPRLSIWKALRTSLSWTIPIRWLLPLVLSVAVGLAGLLLSLVLFRVRISLSLPPAFFTFAVLVVFILIVQPTIALVLGITLTLSYYDRRSPATALRKSQPDLEKSDSVLEVGTIRNVDSLL
jgi:hypothetical protein